MTEDPADRPEPEEDEPLDWLDFHDAVGNLMVAGFIAAGAACGLLALVVVSTRAAVKAGWL